MKYAMIGDSKTEKLKIPHLIFAQSYRCNADCVGCNAVGSEDNIDPEKMKVMIDSWTKYCDENYNEKGIFHLKGGEPLLFENLWDTMNYAADRGLSILVTTNGTFIYQETAERFAELYKKTDGQVIVSLDGSTPQVNDLSRPELYESALNAIKYLVAEGVDVAWNYRVHKGNQEDIENAVKLAKELGVIQFNDLYHANVRNKNGNLEKADLNVVLKQLGLMYDSGYNNLLEWSTEGIIRKVASGEYQLSECPLGFEGLLYVQPNGTIASCPNSTNLTVGNIGDDFFNLFNQLGTMGLTETHRGKIICKGELDASKENQVYRGVLDESNRSIQERIEKLSKKNYVKNPKKISWCFNRNW